MFQWDCISTGVVPLGRRRADLQDNHGALIMKLSNLLRRVFLAAAAIPTAGAASASITISNGTSGSSISSFGFPDSQTYGEVFTAPVTGTLTSFTLSLNGGVGNLYGGVGTWNGGPIFVLGAGSPTNLDQWGHSPKGVQSFTFAPDVGVTAGAQYVAYLSVYGDAGANAGLTSYAVFPGADNEGAGINYFVWQNSSFGPGRSAGKPELGLLADFGPAQFTNVNLYDIPAVNQVIMLAGFAASQASLATAPRVKASRSARNFPATQTRGGRPSQAV